MKLLIFVYFLIWVAGVIFLVTQLLIPYLRNTKYFPAFRKTTELDIALNTVNDQIFTANKALEVQEANKTLNNLTSRIEKNNVHRGT